MLGTAGHIDHGKTALVQALTGVDTDRLVEEKRRGITIELGFASYAPAADLGFGIVDVPGHEGFVRTMVAGATGIDVALLVVAADEGVMPQTREHLAIVALLGVGALVVAVTKVDLVDPEWLELVVDEIGDLLADAPFGDAEVVATSARTGEGLDDLSAALARCARNVGARMDGDLARLPVDRVFSMEGAGTVATGTLWSGRLERGSTVRILPGGGEARIRSIQVHGDAVGRATAGQRTAVALTGAAVRRGMVGRGDVLVDDPSWEASTTLTARLAALSREGGRLKTGRRVRVHLGTVEVMARVALFDVPGELAGGRRALAQLRLEGPVVARAGDRFVVRSYSPVATIAGGVVLEPVAPKRKRLSGEDRRALERIARGGAEAVAGAVDLAGWRGLDSASVGVRAGWPGPPTDQARGDLARVRGRLFAPSVASRGEERVLDAVRRHHRARSLERGAPLAVVRAALPRSARPGLADGLVERLVRAGRIVVEGKVARLPDFEPQLSSAEAELARRLERLLADAGLEGPETDDLTAQAGGRPETRAVLDFLASEGRVRLLGDAYWTSASALDRAAERLVDAFGGREGLGPADFRDVLPVTRKRLIPILAHFDALGVTLRRDGGRSVAKEPP